MPGAAVREKFKWNVEDVATEHHMTFAGHSKSRGTIDTLGRLLREGAPGRREEFTSSNTAYNRTIHSRLGYTSVELLIRVFIRNAGRRNKEHQHYICI